MRKRVITLLLALLVSGIWLNPAQAQETAPVTVVASGLINPQGFAFGSDGTLYVAEAGIGGDTMIDPAAPWMTGGTARFVRIDNGCPTTVVDTMPSARSTSGLTLGLGAVAIIGDRSFVLSAGGGESHANKDLPVSVIEVTGGSAVELADLSTWMHDNMENAPDADGIWVSLVPVPDGSGLVALERLTGQVVRIGLDGTLTRLADLSSLGSEVSDLAFGSDGTLYAALFSASPYAAGTSSVVSIGTDGTTTPVWTGLTMVSAITVDAKGTIFAAEYSEARTEPPYFVPGSGQIIRQNGIDQSVPVLAAINFPGDLAIGPDGALFVSTANVGADGGAGQILRIASDSEGLNTQSINLTGATCGDGLEAPTVKVSDYGFEPSTVTIQIGGTVVWRNVGEMDHAVASATNSPLEWDSGVLTPGQEFILTFPDPGTYPYFDGLNPERTGVIIVTT